MKIFLNKLASFLSYHNAVPIVVGILFAGGASAFAAAATGVLPLNTILAPTSDAARPQKVDVSALLSANLDAFDFSPTVTGVSETANGYTISYSIQTLSPQDGAWALHEKTGEFVVAKDALDATGLQGYAVMKLKDLENGERAYLVRAQEAERNLASERVSRPSSAFAALVGLALDQIPVPVVEKPASEPPANQPEPQSNGPAASEGIAQTAQSQTQVMETATTSVPSADADVSTATSSAIGAQTASSTSASTNSSPDSIGTTTASSTPAD